MPRFGPTRILVELQSNPLWRVHANSRWVCPFDGSLGPLWNDDPFSLVHEVARYLRDRRTDVSRGFMSLDELYAIKDRHESNTSSDQVLSTAIFETVVIRPDLVVPEARPAGSSDGIISGSASMDVDVEVADPADLSALEPAEDVGDDDVAPSPEPGGADSGDSDTEVLTSSDINTVPFGLGRRSSSVSPLRPVRQDPAFRRALGTSRLAPPPAYEGLEFAVLYEPADQVGGDFYDFVKLRDGRSLGIVQGDVSGHGLEVWGDMTTSMRTLRNHARKGCTYAEAGKGGGPAEVLIRANDDLLEDLMTKTFVSACYSILDTESFTLSMARAGHNPLILFNAARQTPLQTMQPAGMVLGMADDEMFRRTIEPISLQLYAGDTLLWYTDGVTETMDEAGQEWQLDRLLQAVEAYGRLGPEDLLRAIRLELDAYRGSRPFDDDLTIIALQII